MNKIKRIFAIILACIIINPVCVKAAEPQITAKGAVLMELSTGKIIYTKEGEKPLPPASVTKVMTLLLIYEAVERGDIKWQDMVQVSENAASMGGSQIFLEPGEQQSVEALTKAIAIASANDGAVAMAEYIAGSEQAFVDRMNEKAKALGMSGASFKNACGLDTDGHLLSPKDIAIMSRELLLKHPDIKKYTTTWQDTITHSTKRGDSTFGLTNTNKLIKSYNGITGLKTGSTSGAGCCLSASAKRDNMELVAVIMGAENSKTRFKEAAELLNYGFANYSLSEGEPEGKEVAEVPVAGGCEPTVKAITKGKVSLLTQKGKNNGELKPSLELSESVVAPVEEGAVLGYYIYTVDNKEVARQEIVAATAVEKAGLLQNLAQLFKVWLEG